MLQPTIGAVCPDSVDLFAHVEARNLRRADDDAPPGLPQLLQVVQDQTVIHTGSLSVDIAVDALDVVQENVRMRQHLLKRCIRHVPCRVNRNLYAFCAAALRQLRHEIWIQHALAAGEGHATACSIIIRLISAEDIQQ